jgi:hypothetical protein
VLIQKAEKLLEQCKYWLACKNGEKNAHIISSYLAKLSQLQICCKIFDHPNFKYDSNCAETDCAFICRSKRIPVPLKPMPNSTNTINSTLLPSL